MISLLKNWKHKIFIGIDISTEFLSGKIDQASEEDLAEEKSTIIAFELEATDLNKRLENF